MTTSSSSLPSPFHTGRFWRERQNRHRRTAVLAGTHPGMSETCPGCVLDRLIPRVSDAHVN
jgi:hypothetical protein